MRRCKMSKIVLVERTNLLKLRLEKILEKLGFSEITVYEGSILKFESFLNKVGEVSVFIIDFDQFADELNEYLSAIRDSSAECKSKIVVLTSKTDVSVMATLFTKHINEIVLKPFSDEIFIEKLSRLNSIESVNGLDVIGNMLKGGGTMLSWCKDYEIGVEEIDNEHKGIIEHFEKLYKLMKDGHGHEYYPELINFLENYIHTHFEHEEALQKKINYTDYEIHRGLHNDFKNQVEIFISEHKESTITNIDLVKINLFIKEWLLHHILVEDKKIGTFVISKTNK